MQGIRPDFRRVPSVLSGALCLWAVLWQVSGGMLAPVRWGVYLAPFTMLLCGALCGLATLRRSWAEAMCIGAVGLLLAFKQPGLVHRSGQVTETGQTISLTTLSNRTRNRDLAATAAALRAHPADIFVLQEVARPKALVQKLRGIYPDAKMSACGAGNFAIVSRHPVGAPHPASSNIAMFCEVKLSAGRAWVGSVHLPRATFNRFRQRRATDRILAIVDQLDAPVILAGDLNATPMATTTRRLSARLQNVYDARGPWPGFTFPTPARRLGTLGAFLRIDHVFASQTFRPLSAKVASWHPPGADHYPLVVRLADTRR